MTSPDDHKRAQEEHDRCVARWMDLSDDQLAGTTMHGVEAHLRPRQRPPTP